MASNKGLARESADVIKKGTEVVKDGATLGKAGLKAAAGDWVGAGAEVAKNPQLIFKLILFGLLLLIMPILMMIGIGSFMMALPGTVTESVQSALSQSTDSIVVGWEDFKARLSNGIDDFLVWITTGEKGTNTKEYNDTIAYASDPVFQTYMGTSNVLVAVLSEYFNDAYAEHETLAQQKATDKVEEMAADEDIAENARKHASQEHPDAELQNDVTFNKVTEGAEYESKNYMQWVFYIMAGDSYKARTEPTMFRAAQMLNAAKAMKKEELWNINLSQSVSYYSYTETRTRHYTVYVTDEDGNVKSETRSEDYEVVFPCAVVKVTYKISPKASSIQYILDYYGVTDESDIGAMTDKELVEEQVRQMMKLYNAAATMFDGDSAYDTGGPMGGLVVSGALSTLMNNFLANNPDKLFDAPGMLPGPWSGWKGNISSHLGANRGGTRHNGTDIVPPSSKTPLYAASKGIIVAVQDNYANGDMQYNGQAQRGNFVMIYYGGDASNAQFCVYQHMSPGIKVSVGQTVEAGTLLGTTGWSGMCFSSTGGTGEHLHLEQYIGGRQVDPYSMMQN